MGRNTLPANFSIRGPKSATNTNTKVKDGRTTAEIAASHGNYAPGQHPQGNLFGNGGSLTGHNGYNNNGYGYNRRLASSPQSPGHSGPLPEFGLEPRRRLFEAPTLSERLDLADSVQTHEVATVGCLAVLGFATFTF